MISKGVGPKNAAIAVGWSLRQLRELQSDAQFVEVMEAAREQLIESIEEKSAAMAIAGNCVTPDVRVLTEDLQWVAAGDLLFGERLIGFDEYRLEGERARRYRIATVLSTGLDRREVWRLRFADGQSVRCTPDHPWIVTRNRQLQGGDNRLFWLTPPDIAQRLATGGPRRGPSSAWIVRPFAPWSTPPRDYAAGFLAGAFDADGSISMGSLRCWPTAEFSQYANPLLDAVKQALDEHGFPYKEGSRMTPNSRLSSISYLRLKDRWQTLRFLGQMRPPRLLDNWLTRGAVEGRTFSRLGEESLREVVSAEPDGEAEICTLATSTGTFLTEYGATHNTPMIQMWLYCHGQDRGWRPPTHRVNVSHQGTPAAERVLAVTSAALELMAKHGHQALALGGPLDKMEDVVDAEVVDD